VTATEIGELHAAVFGGFIEENIPECGEYCPWGSSCFERFLLLETGEVKPWKFDRADTEPVYWASWPRCPRMFMGSGHVYMVDSSYESIAEVCRWAVERGLHRSDRLTAKSSMLLREYTRIRERPGLLKIHVEAQKRKGR